jgi:uncharacterized protein YvpB
MKKKLKLPPDCDPRHYKQSNRGSCGPNAMKRIISYKQGLNILEQHLINLSNCSQKNGASVKGIAKIADSFNLDCIQKNNSSISDLINSINEGNPIILLIQAWPDKKIKNWSETWSYGHYIDVLGFDTLEEKIFYYDPYDGKDKEISYKKLDERWHDKTSKELYNKFGMFFIN